jgi:hypothetical protein
VKEGQLGVFVLDFFAQYHLKYLLHMTLMWASSRLDRTAMDVIYYEGMACCRHSFKLVHLDVHSQPSCHKNFFAFSLLRLISDCTNFDTTLSGPTISGDLEKAEHKHRFLAP